MREKTHKIIFDKISKGDAKLLAVLDKECFSVPWSENSFLNECDNEVAYYVIARYNDEIVGYLGYWKVVDEAQITNIAVKVDFRRCGIARKMIDIAVENAKNDNLSTMSLEVRASNLAAISLYLSKGFFKVGFRKNYYNNPTEDAVLMQLDL